VVRPSSRGAVERLQAALRTSNYTLGGASMPPASLPALRPAVAPPGSRARSRCGVVRPSSRGAVERLQAALRTSNYTLGGASMPPASLPPLRRRSHATD